MRLKDKVIIITGSTGGIGEAIARAVVDNGGQVLIHGLDQADGEQVVASIGNGRAALHIDDLTDPDSPGRIICAAVKAFGRVDGIVNNAAWMVRSNIDTTDADLFDRCMAINVRAPLLLVKTGLNELKRSKGCVLNIGSVNGYGGETNQLAYSIAKAGLMTMSRNLGDALGTAQVRVNHLVLGWVLSENERKLKIKEGLSNDWYEHQPRQWVPTGKMTLPRDIAAAAIFWLGDESRPFSGCVMELEQFPMLGRNPPRL